VLEKLVSVNPTARWWIKGDGTDVIKGLWQSVTGEWSGDVDLNDGKLQQLYTEFKATLGWIDKIGLDTSDISLIRKDLENALTRISLEINFISNGMYLILLYLRMHIVRSLELQTANSAYEEKLKSSSSNDQTMFS